MAASETIRLVRTAEGLALTDGSRTLHPDFRALLPRLKYHNLTQELVVRAAKIKGRCEELTVLDATAGLGEDSFLLAAAGFRVVLYELDSMIAALLRDALTRALAEPMLAPAAKRMVLVEGDSIAAMRAFSRSGAESTGRPDIIFLDPMFPERKKSGLIGKKFQLLQQLEHPCSNEAELLEAALAVHPQKIIIKRPLKGPWLAGRKPDYGLPGKAIRMDCIVL